MTTYQASKEWCMPAFVVTVVRSSTPNISQHTSHLYLVHGSHPASLDLTFSLQAESLSSSPLGLPSWHLHLYQTPRPCVFPKPSPGCGWGDLGFNILCGFLSLGLSTNKVPIFRFPVYLLSPSWKPLLKSCTIFLFPYETLHCPCAWNLHGICSLWHCSQYPKLKSGPKMGEWVGK